MTITQLHDNAFHYLLSLYEKKSLYEYNKDLNKLEDMEILIENTLLTFEAIGMNYRQLENEVIEEIQSQQIAG